GTSNGCDFEDGLCGWSHDITDDFNWVINQGETPTANTGPEADHTKNDSSDVGSLEVFIRAQKIPTIALDTDHQIFYKTGNLGDNWIKADVIMPQVTEPVQVMCLSFKM
uniref:MAM domain-containing protein n=1 Tax=Biomphalaria glabrata TaxID=6526 RepID=A0A2C9LR76_BIOGL